MSLSQKVNFVFYLSIVLFLLTYVIDQNFFSNNPMMVLVVELGAEFFGILYLICKIKRQNYIAILMLINILCFFISDIFYSYIFYYTKTQNPSGGVWSVSFTNTLSYISMSIALIGLNVEYLKNRINKGTLKNYLPIFFIIFSFIYIAYVLFGSVYQERYGVSSYELEDIIRLSAPYSGAIALSFGFIGLRYSRNLISSMFSLGIVLQVLSDWVLKHKNFIQAESYLSIGENMFMVGILLYVSSSVLYYKENYTTKDEPIPESGTIESVLIVALGVYLALHYNRLFAKPNIG